MRAFRVLLVFLAASTILGSLGLLGFGNLLGIQEARFLTAMDSMRDAVILTDARQEIIYANPPARSLMAANGQRPNDRSLPSALQHRPASFALPDGIETSLVDSAGRRRAVSVSIEDIREPSGRTLGSVYLVRDLTEWRRLVASVASAFINLQMEDADDAVRQALDEAASLCGAQHRALLLFQDPTGTASHGAVGVTKNDGFPSAIINWVRTAAAAGVTVVLNSQTTTGKDADLLAQESVSWAAAVPLRLAGAVVGAIALAGCQARAEIGARERGVIEVLGVLIVELLTKRWAMGEMNRLGAEYHDLIESANVPIWGVDMEGKVNEWNGVVASLTGRPKTEVTGLPALAVLDPVHASSAFETLMAAVLGRERIAAKELQITSVSGMTCTLLVSGSPRLDSAQRVTGAIFIGQDITARISAERRIKDQARALIGVQEIERLRISRDLHDGVAQDLSAARIGCETFLDDPTKDERQLRERLEKIAAPISAALESIRAIAYDLRSADQGPGSLSMSLARVCASFGRAHTLEVTFQASGAEKVELPPESTANMCRITQEVLSNAARHACARRVEVALVYSHPDVILRIIDDGAGFDVEQSFAEAFERKRMGLLGVRERAAILGATMSIVSKSGKGTQVRLTVPVPQAGGS